MLSTGLYGKRTEKRADTRVWGLPRRLTGEGFTRQVGDAASIPSLGREHPLEKEMAIHSSTLAWKIPWMEEPDRLQSMGSQRVRHD